MNIDSTYTLSLATGLFVFAAVAIAGVVLVVIRFSKRSSHHPPVSNATRHFLRIISGAIDEVFQLSDKDTSNRAREAYRNGGFFRFTTLKGRRCVINFRQVQAVGLTEMPEISANSDSIDGIQIYLTNRCDYFDIQADAREIDRFLDEFTGDSLILGLGDWLFDRYEIVIAATDSVQQATGPYQKAMADYQNGNIDGSGSFLDWSQRET